MTRRIIQENGSVRRIIYTGAPGQGGSTFAELTDTPNSYAGEAGNAVVVAPGEDGLEFVAATGTGDMTKAVYDPGAKNAQLATEAELNAHVGDTANPHAVTAAQAGADPAGSASTVQGNLDTHEADTSNPHNTTAAQAGALAIASNLADVANASTSRDNIGLGDADSPTFAAVNTGAVQYTDGGGIYDANANDVLLVNAAPAAQTGRMEVTAGNNEAAGGPFVSRASNVASCWPAISPSLNSWQPTAHRWSTAMVRRRTGSRSTTRRPTRRTWRAGH